MASQRQVNLDELIQMLLSRMEGLAMADENLKTRLNIISRVLYNKGLITDEEIKDSIREEHNMLKELELVSELPDEETVEAVAESILQWIKGDVEGLKRNMAEYEQQLKEAQQSQQQPRIDVASPDMLNELERRGGGQQGGSNLIL
ncbi:MAG: hypothetical protein K9L28_10290 [Synergistales bacterium]|nr:hypothetical protein [Synergistales bacterium]